MVGVLALVAVSALVLRASASIPGLLVARQNIISVPDVPSTCLSDCSTVTSTISACQNLACICSKSNADSLTACVACIISNDPETSVINTADSLINAFNTDCAAAGFPVSIGGIQTASALPTTVPITTASRTTTTLPPTTLPTTTFSTAAHTGLPANGPIGHNNAGVSVRVSMFGCLLGAALGAVKLLVY